MILTCFLKSTGEARAAAPLMALLQRAGVLVRHFAMKYGCGFDYSDLYQSGMLGLIKTTKNYNGRALFSTWASWCIIREIRHFVRGE